MKCSTSAVLLPFILCAALTSFSYGQCRSKNLCFALDESGSIGENFPNITTTINDIVDRYADLAPGTSYSAVALGPNPQIISNLTSDVSAFKELVDQNQRDAGSTEDMGGAFRACSNLTSEGSRQQVILLLADGDDAGGDAREVSADLQEQGITIATVGIGSNVNGDLLQEIASEPNLYTDVSDCSVLTDNIINITETIFIPSEISELLVGKPSILVPLILSLLFGGVVVISVIPAVFPIFNFSWSVGNV